MVEIFATAPWSLGEGGSLIDAYMARREGVTEAIRRLQAGEDGALDRLVPLIYEELRLLARRQVGAQPPGATLDTTGLVHELYLRLAARRPTAWRDRGHFFATAARAMRHIVIDHAKGRRRQKRGGGQPHVALDESQIAVKEEAAHLIAVDEALTRLAIADERLARVVECRFFAGLSDVETAEALGVSPRTVQRAWGEARSWLKRDMGGSSRSVP
jgi:RNA polymerase sigma factor (TIGR02999 family)